MFFVRSFLFLAEAKITQKFFAKQIYFFQGHSEHAVKTSALQFFIQ